uniref:Uncharacterized protein n=1 Tax=Setaria digitata TaxID=48799 RepID=A0A915PZ22_9BILA
MNEVVIVLGLAILLVTPPCLMDKYEYDDYELSEEEKMSADFDDYDEYSLEEEDDDISDSSDEGDQSEEEDNQDEDETDYGDYVTKGKFVQTDGRQKVCRSHEDCYDQREPQSWLTKVASAPQICARVSSNAETVTGWNTRTVPLR